MAFISQHSYAIQLGGDKIVIIKVLANVVYEFKFPELVALGSTDLSLKV